MRRRRERGRTGRWCARSFWRMTHKTTSDKSALSCAVSLLYMTALHQGDQPVAACFTRRPPPRSGFRKGTLMHSRQLAFERFFSGLALSAALALAGYAVLIGAGVVAALSPLTYFADEWAWLSFNVVRGHGSFCRLWGHPIFTSNLLLSANYNLYDGAPIGRAVAASSVHVLGMFLVGTGSVALREAIESHA